jgi:hypothetical protein
MNLYESKKFYFVRTNGKGVPAVWENTREYKDLTRIIQIFDSNGHKKKPLFTKENNTSLTMILESDYIVKLFYDDNGTSASILRIMSIDKYSNEADVVIEDRFCNNEWQNQVEESNAIFNIKQNIANFLITKG